MSYIEKEGHVHEQGQKEERVPATEITQRPGSFRVNDRLSLVVVADLDLHRPRISWPLKLPRHVLLSVLPQMRVPSAKKSHLSAVRGAPERGVRGSRRRNEVEKAGGGNIVFAKVIHPLQFLMNGIKELGEGRGARGDQGQGCADRSGPLLHPFLKIGRSLLTWPMSKSQKSKEKGGGESSNYGVI